MQSPTIPKLEQANSSTNLLSSSSPSNSAPGTPQIGLVSASPTPQRILPSPPTPTTSPKPLNFMNQSISSPKPLNIMDQPISSPPSPRKYPNSNFHPTPQIPSRPLRATSPQSKLRVGNIVMAKYDDGEYYKAVIRQYTPGNSTPYWVVYEGYSESDGRWLSEQDIQS